MLAITTAVDTTEDSSCLNTFCIVA